MSDQVNVETIKEINTQPYQKLYVGKTLLAEVYPMSLLCLIEENGFDVSALPEPVAAFYKWIEQQGTYQDYV